MHRRHFIRITGASLASLFVTEGILAQGQRLSYPVSVAAMLDDGLHTLQSGDHLVWTFKDLEVALQYGEEGLSVLVTCPGMALHHLQLEWNYAAPGKATVLGDHWERTYGDVSFQKPAFSKKLPWYFIEAQQKQSSCFGVKTGAASICNWQVGEGILRLVMDTRSGGVGVRLGDRTLQAATIVTTRSLPGETVFATGRRFCALMCTKPRLPKMPVYGINDWYFAYGKNSSELILQHTALLADLATDTDNRPFSVVDAGWAAYSPLLPGDCCWQDDFSKPNEHFKDMARLATEIGKLGMRPGLWTRPLCAAHNDPQALLLPAIPGRNNPKTPVLDPTIPENLERIKRNISLYREWGYQMVKHDFSTYDILGKWGFEMQDDITTPGWKLNDGSRTNAEVILCLYQAIRAAAGEMYLIGCNTIGHLSAGIFELNRVGDDTSGNEWDRTRKMGVNTLGFRMIQHLTFFAADGDCVGLTSKVPWAKNKQWMELLAQSSTPLFISAQPDAVGKEQKDTIRKSFATAARQLPIGEPLDWLTMQWPRHWKLDNQLRTFDWS